MGAKWSTHEPTRGNEAKTQLLMAAAGCLDGEMFAYGSCAAAAHPRVFGKANLLVLHRY